MLTIVGPRRGALLIAAVTALAVAGCGSDDDSGATSTSSGAAASTTASTGASTAAAAPAGGDDALYKGFQEAPPATGPAPVKGKSVVFVSCGMSIPDCAVPANAAKEAAAAIGWKLTIADGALNVGGGNVRAMRDAIAQKPDAIIVHGIDCPIIKTPLQDAKRAKIPVLGLESIDCNAPGVGTGDPLYTADMKYSSKAESTAQYFNSWGILSARYLGATLPDAQIINQRGTNPGSHRLVNEGFINELKTACPGCKIIDELTFSSPDQIPNGPLEQRTKTALIKYPNATAIQMPFDVNILGAGGAKDVKDAQSKAIIVGGSGSVGAMDLVRSGDVAMVAAHDSNWMGWGAIDEINRILNGQDAVPEGIGSLAVTKDHNLPAKAGSAYASPIDYKAAYKKLWAAG